MSSWLSSLESLAEWPVLTPFNHWCSSWNPSVLCFVPWDLLRPWSEQGGLVHRCRAGGLPNEAFGDDERGQGAFL